MPGENGTEARERSVREMLRSAGLKITPLRVQVLEFLIDAGRPLSHADVHAVLPDLDRVTLYRTLASFVESDIAHQVQGQDGTWRFCAHSRDEDCCPGNHPHFLCEACGTMICLTGQSMPRVEVPPQCRVAGKQFVVYGKCPACAQKDV